MKKLFGDMSIVEGNYIEAHQDWEVPIPGFFILATKRDIKSISEFTDAEAKEYIYLLRKIRQGMLDELGIEDVYFFQNEDSSSGFHVWIFPRHTWMNQWGTKIESVRPIMNYAKEHMKTEEVFQEVEEYVNIMRKYMK